MQNKNTSIFQKPEVSKIKKFYDDTAHRYDLRQANPSTLHLRRAEESALRKFAKGRILDIGCGTGYHLAFLQKNNIGDELVGVDISKQMLQQARKKCGCKVIEAQAEDLPFPDKSFDTIICFNSTLNLCEYRKAAAEMARVLRKHGHAILSVTGIWDKAYPDFWNKLKSQKENTTKSLRLEDTKLRIELFSKNKLIELFEQNGFQLRYLKGLFIYQRPYWGRFEDFSRWQKIKLALDGIFPFNMFAQVGCVYLAVFKK